MMEPWGSVNGNVSGTGKTTMIDPILIQNYSVTIFSEDIPEEHREEFYEYLRIYDAQCKHVIRKRDGKRGELYRIKMPGYLIQRFTGHHPREIFIGNDIDPPKLTEEQERRIQEFLDNL